MTPEQVALIRRICEEYPWSAATVDVIAVLDGATETQTCRAPDCDRWQLRPPNDDHPDYWVCSRHGDDAVYCGPKVFAEKIIAGQPVTFEDWITDTSEWIAMRVLPGFTPDLGVPTNLPSQEVQP